MKKLRLTPVNGRDTLAAMKRLFAGGVFFLLVNMSFADDSTINAGSKGPEPLDVKAGEQSPIRMVSEDLEFHFTTNKTRVIATFHFLNPTKSMVHQTLGFPDEGLAAQKASGRKDVEGDGVPGPIEEMKSFVNGRKLDSKVEYGYVKWSPDRDCWLPAAKGDEDASLMAWHILAVDFPPGKEVIVERQYTVEDGGQNGGVYFFTYTVHTGSSWQGKIGRLRATVFLEGGLTVDELGWTRKILRGGYIVEPSRKEWKIVSPKKMTLEWDNFKPSEEKGKQEIEVSARDKKLDAEMLKAGQPLPTAD